MDGTLVSLNGLLIGNQIYDIPVYQRGYAWARKNLEDLWEDLYYLDPTKKHYFGTVLLKDSGKTASTLVATLKRFDVIDGQQRLTTVLILLREIISQLKEIGTTDIKEAVNALERDYLKHGPHYKLNPLGADGDFFHHFIIDGIEFLTSSAKTRSQRRLTEAKAFFRDKLISEKAKQHSTYQNFLVQFKQKIDNLQLIQYQVNSDADAIRIFETVNDRGRPLSNLEKTKSFLMHTSYLGIKNDDEVAGRLNDLNSHFSRIYHHFEDVSETKHMERLRLDENDVLRYHFINYISTGDASSRPTDSLKDRIRDMLRKDPKACVEYALTYARDLEETYFAVKQITEAYKKDAVGGTLSKIFMLERMGNIFPLLIASWLRFRDDVSRLAEILKLLETFIVRVYLVGWYRSDTGRSTINRIAHRVHRQTLDYDGLLGQLKDTIRYYQNDKQFRRSLGWSNFYESKSSRAIKFLLSEYEIHLRRKVDVPLAVSTQETILSSEYEVEHIWAQHPSREMNIVEQLQHQENVHRLGNLTIAHQAWNKSMGNRTFQDKQFQPDGAPSYSNSILLVQKELAELSSWDVDAIETRESDIVAFALQRWTI
ncbi:MAG: DUF262 domain-containing protein [Caldilineaceae bacterium SB0664_bin_22]|nr:DUF262 domain-containing protein [Caldilineaceae bacterium SB0664_bin_22]